MQNILKEGQCNSLYNSIIFIFDQQMLRFLKHGFRIDSHHTVPASVMRVTVKNNVQCILTQVIAPALPGNKHVMSAQFVDRLNVSSARHMLCPAMASHDLGKRYLAGQQYCQKLGAVHRYHHISSLGPVALFSPLFQICAL